MKSQGNTLKAKSQSDSWKLEEIREKTRSAGIFQLGIAQRSTRKFREKTTSAGSFNKEIAQTVWKDS